MDVHNRPVCDPLQPQLDPTISLNPFARYNQGAHHPTNPTNPNPRRSSFASDVLSQLASSSQPQLAFVSASARVRPARVRLARVPSSSRFICSSWWFGFYNLQNKGNSNSENMN
ncbi:hypothetical protein F2Q70_00022171 [Brassica cretica]|uniref:Uncharacterized protein n=1 Tax=Brassica cretica TaxID=69181 RepID=A0A8S9GL48_BRACR|nr:hypothetical protein F2Q70_00022171 [Brassica cretica]